MYNLYAYGTMIADARREAYAEAMRRAVKPGSVVIDLGSGPGLWALYACQLGAARVYAIEPDDVIGVAEAAARANGFADRVRCIADRSTRVTLPEQADVIVSDVRGVMSPHEAGLEALIDARRFLAPGGVMIPARDDLWVSVVHAPAEYRGLVGPWEDRPLGMDYQAARDLVVNTWSKMRCGLDALLAEPQRWCTLDFRTLATTHVGGDAGLQVTRASTAHGLVAWFESDLVEGVRLSNRPGDSPLLYGQAFFPWPRPLALEAGDQIDVRIAAHPVHGAYVWRWQTTVHKGPSRPAPIRFDQSTMNGAPLVASRLRHLSSDRVVDVGDDARIDRCVLDGLIAGLPIGDAAAALRATYPAAFPGAGDALARVVRVAERYVEPADAWWRADRLVAGERE